MEKFFENINLNKSLLIMQRSLSNKFGFLDMCNKIVHSRTHTLKDDFIFEAEKDKTGVYVEIIAERKNKKDEHAVLVLLSFVECCTILSNINSKILIANK